MIQAPEGIVHDTSSWSEKSWVGPFYPEGMKPADFRYAGHGPEMARTLMAMI